MKDKCLYGLVGLIKDIKTEHKAQINKWGVQDHEPSEWLMFLTEEVGELAEAIADWQFRDGHEQNVIDEAIQTATLSLKIAEMFKCEKDRRFVNDYYSKRKDNG